MSTQNEIGAALDFKGLWQYDAAPEDKKQVKIAPQYNHFINGKFTPSTTGEYFDTINPATEEKLSELALGSVEDVDKAVKAAKKAQKDWAKLPGKERGKYLYRIARLIQERARAFSVIETLNGGKPIRESRDVDVPLAVAHFFYYAGWADKLDYAFPGRSVSPKGVAAQIIPWNFPLLMAAWKLAPALACGNTVVLKPAETTPLTAMFLAELIRDADLPDGVVNIVNGYGPTGATMVNHPDINKVAFTGSTPIGKYIQQSLAGRDVSYTLELGGKAANIIMEDAPIDQAVEGIINAIFFNQGHVCCAGSRLFVQESVADEVLRKLKYRLDTLIVGDPMDKNTDIGAINSRKQLDKINELVQAGIAEGGHIYRPNIEMSNKGFWCAPTLFTEVSQAHRIVNEEIFGPVLAIQTFRTPAEAIKKANNTPFGLSGGVWTDKGSKIFNVTSQIHAGVIWANTFNRFDPTSPFGGYKESGMGREGGLHGLYPYVNLD
ncbi:MAG: aldehyde dehydrogenase family protein [Bacteroidetes bacterium]|nr:aldehyde dehydrogenase family protein [Bacteroidota bacterium]